MIGLQSSVERQQQRNGLQSAFFGQPMEEQSV